MTTPNKTAGLSSQGLEWAFSVDNSITGDHSISGAVQRTQSAVTDILKSTMQGSPGWLSAVSAAYNDLTAGIPLVTGIIFSVLDKIWDLTGLGFIWEPSDILDYISNGLSILGGIIPGLDASKIISGFFPQGMINGLSGALSTLTSGIQNTWNTLTGIADAGLSQVASWVSTIPNLIGGLLSGSWIPGLDASKIISGFFPQGMVTGLVSGLSSITGNIQSTWNNLWSAFNGVTGATGKGLPDLLAAGQGVTAGIANALTGVSSIIDGVVQGFMGLFGVGWSQADANSAVQSQAASTTANTAAIASITQEKSTNAQAGKSVDIDFTLLANSAILPVGFAQTNSGTGTATLGVSSGQAQMVNEAWNGSRTVTGVYTAVQTLTDYQIVGCVISAVPARDDTSYHTLCGRSNLAGSTRVELQLYSNKVVLGCFVGGSFTSFTTLDHTLQSGSAYYLQCGTAGGVRIFRVYVNSTLLFSYSEAGTVSQAGASFRYTCIGVFDKGSRFVASSYAWWDGGHLFPSNYFVYETPGSVSRWLMSDNAIPTYLGTLARFTRLATTPVTAAADVPFPANFLDTVEYCTPDITWNPATQAATVTKEGLYVIEVGYKSNATSQGGVVFLLNGVLKRVSEMSDHTWGQGTFSQYLHINDTVSPGSHFGIALTGDAAGLFSFFNLSKVA